MGALTTLLLGEAAGEPGWLVDIVDMDAEGQTGVFWHCGSAPLSMRDPDCPARAQIHSNRKMPLLAEFTLKPGGSPSHGSRNHRTGSPLCSARAT